jgi:hypothetical protein
MNKCEIAKHFDVSRATVNDWQRRGAPIGKDGGDPAAVAEWKAGRDMERAGVGAKPVFQDLPELIGEITRRRLHLDQRIEMVNKWPPNITCEPGLIKASVVGGLILERALLGIPGKIISDPSPATLPTRLIRAVLDALDEAKG